MIHKERVIKSSPCASSPAPAVRWFCRLGSEVGCGGGTGRPSVVWRCQDGAVPPAPAGRAWCLGCGGTVLLPWLGSDLHCPQLC